MDSEVEEKWLWIFKQLHRGMEVTRSAWRRFMGWNHTIHQNLHANHPIATRFIGGILRFFYGTSTHPAFAVLLALLLVGFVISGAITIIISVSVFFAWLITVLWLGHSEPVQKLNILPRVVFVLTFASVAAFGANWYVKWCLKNYAKNQPPPVQNLGEQIKDAFHNELKNLPTPTIASHPEPLKLRIDPRPIVRITGLSIRPIQPGSL
ncbi:MAG TPA: hypothetical protein VGI45_19750 [Terracidiphilus sp.]